MHEKVGHDARRKARVEVIRQILARFIRLIVADALRVPAEVLLQHSVARHHKVVLVHAPRP